EAAVVKEAHRTVEALSHQLLGAVERRIRRIGPADLGAQAATAPGSPAARATLALGARGLAPGQNAHPGSLRPSDRPPNNRRALGPRRAVAGREEGHAEIAVLVRSAVEHTALLLDAPEAPRLGADGREIAPGCAVARARGHRDGVHAGVVLAQHRQAGQRLD